MAIEDYKVDNNDIMCWDRDGRHNINISPHRLKLNQVSEILSEIPEFTLIKGLLKSTQEFRQYTKLGASLYEMSAEVANERTALKNNSSPIIRQPKKYLRAEGFEGDRNYGCYSAPTNYLPDNFVEKHFQIETCLVQIDPSNNHIKMILQDPGLYLHGLDRFEDLDLPRDLNIIIDAGDERGAMSGDNLYISYSFEYDNLEDFKKAWEQYKKDLPARLKKFNDTLENLDDTEMIGEKKNMTNENGLSLLEAKKQFYDGIGSNGLQYNPEKQVFYCWLEGDIKVSGKTLEELKENIENTISYPHYDVPENIKIKVRIDKDKEFKKLEKFKQRFSEWNEEAENAWYDDFDFDEVDYQTFGSVNVDIYLNESLNEEKTMSEKLSMQEALHLLRSNKTLNEAFESDEDDFFEGKDPADYIADVIASDGHELVKFVKVDDEESSEWLIQVDDDDKPYWYQFVGGRLYRLDK